MKSPQFIIGVGIGVLLSVIVLGEVTKSMVSSDQVEYIAQQKGMIYPSEYKFDISKGE